MSSALQQVLLVGTGGFVGSVLRFGTSLLVHRILPQSGFPAPTLVVNVLGCLTIGYLAGLDDVRSVIAPELRLFLFIGLLGGFTTFSTFGYETLDLVRSGEPFKAGLSVLATLALCLLAVWAGHRLGLATS